MDNSAGQTRLVVICDGDLSAVQTLAREHLPRIQPDDVSPASVSAFPPFELLGPQRSEQIAEYLRQADAFLLTSELETQSVVVLEAQLTGLPVITTRSSGPQATLALTGGGTTVPVNDVDALAGAMAAAVVKGPAPAEERAELARRARHHFGGAVVREQLLAHYDACLDA